MLDAKCVILGLLPPVDTSTPPAALISPPAIAPKALGTAPWNLSSQPHQVPSPTELFNKIALRGIQAEQRLACLGV